MTHSQRCIDANRFGDGFDCICDEEPLPRALKRIEQLTAEVDRLSKALEAADNRYAQLEGAQSKRIRELEDMARVRDVDMLADENNALVQQVAMLRAYQRKTDEAIRSVALFIEADDKAGLQHWLRRGIVRIVRGDPRPAPCPECRITGGHKLSCSQAPEPLRRMHAKAKAGTLKITYAGRDEELAYLREAIEKEPDADVRRRMQKRLEYVESKTEAELQADFLEPEDT